MFYQIASILLLLSAFLASTPSNSGESEARKYFEQRKPLTKSQKESRKALFKKNSRGKSAQSLSSADAPHFLTLHWSLPQKTSHFGLSKIEASFNELQNFGMSYRFGYWVNSTDFLLKVDYLKYALSPQVEELSENSKRQTVSQIAFLPTLIFPDSASNFPIYFGISTGLGIFLEQARGRPKTSINYEIFAGIRIFDIVSSWGIFVEISRKARFLLLPSGKHQANYISVGTVSRF